MNANMAYLYFALHILGENEVKIKDLNQKMQVLQERMTELQKGIPSHIKGEYNV